MFNFDFFTFFFNVSIYFATLFLVQNTSILFSVLTLILIACLFSLFIVSFSSLFVGLLYLAIYVGAVTVFILFVVMMTDLSFSVENERSLDYKFLQYNQFTSFNFITSNFFIFTFVCCFTSLFEQVVSLTRETTCSNTPFALLSQSTETQTFELAFVLLQQHIAPFILLGLIILLTLIGSIFVITQNTKQLFGIGFLAFNNELGLPLQQTKSQNMNLQLLVESKNSIKLNSTSYTK